MRKFTLLSTLTIGLYGAQGCKDEPSNDTEEVIDPTPVSPSVRRLLQATCDLSLRCCSRGEVDFFLTPFIDADSCVERLFDAATVASFAELDLSSIADLADVSLIFPNLGALDQAAQDERIVLDEDAFAACRAHLRDLSCNAFVKAPDKSCEALPPPRGESPCDPHNLFVGQLLEGELCTSLNGLSLECAPGLTCGLGVGLGVTGRCIPIKQEGETCTLNLECDRDLYCSALDGTCQRPRQEGEVCVFADREDPTPLPETLLVRCAENLSCDPVTSTCVARCQAGARCDEDTDCDDDQGLSCIVGRCGFPRTAGLPCTQDDDCQEGLHCGPDIFEPAQLVCTAPKPNNADCTVHLECESGFCSSQTLQCSSAVAVGNPCPSGESAECTDGVCVPEDSTNSCFSELDCPLSGFCDTVQGQCGSYCASAKQDGALCELDSECISNACIAGACRTRPLELGVACDGASDCGSEFCSYDPQPVCTELPLPLGSPCFQHDECESQVCFPNTPLGDPVCITGLDEGEVCGATDQPPCNPKKYHCDQELEPYVCSPLKETGEICKSDSQCRDACVVRHGRLLCSPAAPEGTAVCDGSDPTALPSPDDEDEEDDEPEDTEGDDEVDLRPRG